MRIILKPIIILFFVLFTSAGISHAQSFSYVQTFESLNPVQYWLTNTTYKINYFGLSTEKKFEGTKALKVDITINGNGTAEWYYYWKIPVQVNLLNTISSSVYLWMDANSAKFVKVGYSYNFPPTGLTATPIPPSVTQYSTWTKQTVILSQDVNYHAGRLAETKIYGATMDDYGRELSYIPVMARGRGAVRLIFYIDRLEVTGTAISQTIFNTEVNARWSNFRTRISTVVNQRHQQYNALPPIPSTTGISLSAKASEYLQKMKKARTDMLNLFIMIDGKAYFAPKVMDSLETLLGLYPAWNELYRDEVYNSTAKLSVFNMPPTKYNRLTGSNIPEYLENANTVKIRATPGEFEPISLFLMAKVSLSNVKIQWTSLSSASGTIPAAALDFRIAKVWYQNGTSVIGTGKLLTQELLVKNDNLIKVDETAKTNSILVKRSDGTAFYANIGSPSAVFPSGVTIKDSDILQPFSIPAGKNRQIWATLRIPDTQAPGKYTGRITISDAVGVLKTINLEVEVLPFKLDPSVLDYAIYYHGFTDDNNYLKYPFTSGNKSSRQLQIELQDMKEHGISYPTFYQTVVNADKDLQIRNALGFPRDKAIVLKLITDGAFTDYGITDLKSKVTSWKNKLLQYGYSNLFVHGIDEATGYRLTGQRKAWDAVHSLGAKVITSGYYKTFDDMGDLLDIGVIQPQPIQEQAEKYHLKGKKIYNYHNPQAGEENPETYRKNYGFILWKSGYDGSMVYAYQRNYGHIWNDFDIESNQPHPYRDHNFTYPVTDGIISTVQWEGFREGVDDVRYLSTLLNRIKKLKAAGKDVTALQQFVNSIDPNLDADFLRDEIISRILGTATIAMGKEYEEKSNANLNNMPEKYELGQNYPNPFNPMTKIKFSVPEKSLISLIVYDILGKEVATLVNREMDAGYHELVFDASAFSSGIYIYQMKTRNYNETKKMMLIK